jgi:hypothetical protein
MEKTRKIPMNALGFNLKRNLNLFFLNPEKVFKTNGFLPVKTKTIQNNNKLHSLLLFFKAKIISTLDRLSTSKKFRILCFDITW